MREFDRGLIAAVGWIADILAQVVNVSQQMPFAVLRAGFAEVKPNSPKYQRCLMFRIASDIETPHEHKATPLQNLFTKLRDLPAQGWQHKVIPPNAQQVLVLVARAHQR